MSTTPTIPAVKPATNIRDTAVIAYLAGLPGSSEAGATAIFAALPENSKDAFYVTARNATIDAALKANPSLIGTKLAITRAQHNIPGRSVIQTAAVNPTGNATIAAVAGNGQVTVAVVNTINVHVDRIAGLLA